MKIYMNRQASYVDDIFYKSWFQIKGKKMPKILNYARYSWLNLYVNFSEQHAGKTVPAPSFKQLCPCKYVFMIIYASVIIYL